MTPLQTLTRNFNLNSEKQWISLTFLNPFIDPVKMEFTGLMIYSSFDKCLSDNVLEECCSAMPHEDDQMAKTFKFSLKECFIALLPDNTFLTQKEWITNMMKELYTKRIKDIGNRLKTLNHYLTLMPHDDKKDTVFTDTDLKAWLLKSMPS